MLLLPRIPNKQTVLLLYFLDCGITLFFFSLTTTILLSPSCEFYIYICSLPTPHPTPTVFNICYFLKTINLIHRSLLSLFFSFSLLFSWGGLSDYPVILLLSLLVPSVPRLVSNLYQVSLGSFPPPSPRPSSRPHTHHQPLSFLFRVS